MRGDCLNMKTFEDGAFDCVVSTFLFNSCFDREALAEEIKRLCKKDGYILLMERGSSYVPIYNTWLKFRAARDLLQEGIVEHLDFDQIIDELFDGLEIVHRERKNLGMTYVFVIKNKPLPKEED